MLLDNVIGSYNVIGIIMLLDDIIGSYNVIGIVIIIGYGDMTQFWFWVPWNTADIGYGDTEIP